MTTVSPDKDEVERVAAAIYGVPRTDTDDVPHRWDSATDAWRSYSIRQARAAIAAMSPVDRLREALESLRALNQGVYDNDNLPPGQRNFAKLCIDKIYAALSSPEPVGEVAANE